MTIQKPNSNQVNAIHYWDTTQLTFSFLRVELFFTTTIRSMQSLLGNKRNSTKVLEQRNAAVLGLLEACRHDVLHLMRESNLRMDWFGLEGAYTQVCLII